MIADVMPTTKPFQLSDYNEKHSMLVSIRNVLYAGSWDLMSKDLEERKASKPYIFKLVNRIDSDMDMIRHLENLDEDQLSQISSAYPTE